MNTDWFVLSMLKNKRDGFYVELGSAHPINGSNTISLEKKFGWRGLSIDLDENLCNQFNSIRQGRAVCTDALTFDYRKYFEENNFPHQIDYLQVDVDSGYDHAGRSVGNPASSLLALISLPLNTYRFSVITFEHDALINFKYSSVRDAQREILDSLGYSLVQRHSYEDWWVDPEVVPYPEYKNYFKV